MFQVQNGKASVPTRAQIGETDVGNSEDAFKNSNSNLTMNHTPAASL